MTTAVEWQPGDVVADLYEVLDVVRSGGMGLVYRVLHRGWNVELAVKVPRPALVARPGGVTDFETEAETWVGLGVHPHTVSCVYVRHLDGLPRVFAEWVDGGSLAQWVQDRRLYQDGPLAALSRILDVAIQFAWGLEHAHRHRLIHQDVKPANVMLTPDATVKVTDFGLAKARSAAGEATVPPAGASVLVGYGGMTQAYCSPEQAQAAAGESHVMLTRATDMWSWAVSVLELFVGGPPCQHGQAAAEVFEAFVADGPPDPDIPAMPAELARLLRWCFAAEPRDRPARMGELAEELVDLYPELVGVPYPRARPAAARLLADGLNNQALSMLDLGRAKRAEQLWDEALGADPHHPHAVYNRGLHRWRAGRVTDQQLVAELEAVRASHPDDWTDEYLLALVHLERGDVDLSRELLAEAARHSPDDPDIAAALRAANRLPTPRQPVTLEGHTHHVSAVALSADGTIAATGGNSGAAPAPYSADGSVRIWQTATGRCQRVLKRRGYGYGVKAVAMSAGGQVVLSCDGGAGGVRVWDPATGRQLREISGPATDSASLAVTADGTVALTRGRDGALSAWDVVAARHLRTMDGSGVGSGYVGWVAVDPQGRLAVSFEGRTSQIRVWELATGRLVRTRDRCTSRVALSPDGRVVLSGDRETVHVWELATGRELRSVTAHTDWGWSVAVDNAGDIAVSGGQDGTVRVWELSTGRCLRTLTGLQFRINAVALSGDGRLVLAGGTDRNARIWPLPAAGPLAPWSYPRPRSATELTSDADLVGTALERANRLHAAGELTSAADELRAARGVPGYQRHPELLRRWRQLGTGARRTVLVAGWQLLQTDGGGPCRASPDRGIALAAGQGGGLRLLDLDAGEVRHELVGHQARVLSAALSKDGSVGYSAGEDSMRMWDLATGQCTRELRVGTSWAQHSAISRDGLVVMLSAGKDSVQVYDVAAGELRGRMRSQSFDPFRQLSLASDDQLALTTMSGGSAAVWDLRTGRCRHFLAGRRDEIQRLAVDAAAARAFTSDRDGVRVWDLATHRRGLLMKNASKLRNVPSVVVSPEPTQLLTYAGDDVVRVWDVRTGRCLRTLEGHLGWVESAALSPDGTVAITGGTDRTVRVWDMADGGCLSVLEGHTDRVESVSLSADAHRAVSSSADGTTRIWELDWDYDFDSPAAAAAESGRDGSRWSRLLGGR